MQNHIDFVEGEPVLDQALVTGKEGVTEICVKVQHTTIAPTTVLPN